MSCGDDKENPLPPIPPPSSSSFEHPPFEKDPSIIITLDKDLTTHEMKNPDASNLKIKGMVELQAVGKEMLLISIVRRYDTEATATPVNLTNTYFGESYNLAGTSGNNQAGIDMTSCDFKAGDYWFYVYVYLEEGTAAGMDSVKFEKKSGMSANCPQELQIKISPEAGGSVSRNPEGPLYITGDNVRLTPNPASNNYAFFNWTESSYGSSWFFSADNPLDFKVGEADLIANFVESYGLVKVDIDYTGTSTGRNNFIDGDGINLKNAKTTQGGASADIRVLSSSTLEASNGAKITDTFKQKDGSKDQQTRSDYDPTSSFRTNQFVTDEFPANNQVAYMNGRYFVVTTGGGWTNWFLVYYENVLGGDKQMTVWKVQQ
jgi:hypothetical protein